MAKLLPLLTHPAARTRVAVLRATTHLDPDGTVDVLFDALADRTAAVIKTARDLLADRPGLLRPARLEPFLANDHPTTRRVVATLVARMRFWDATPLLLRTLADPVAAVAAAAKRKAEAFFVRPGRSYPKPSPDELADAERAFVQYGHLLRSTVQANVKQVLVYARRQSL